MHIVIEGAEVAMRGLRKFDKPDSLSLATQFGGAEQGETPNFHTFDEKST